MSRRTRRADQPALSTIVSNNPIFFRGDGCADANAVHALVHDGLDDVPAAVAKPLPLPPSRTRSHQPTGSRAGSALMMSRHGSGWVIWREPQHDPFLAAYVTCTKSDGKVDAAPVKRQQKKNKNKNRGGIVQGCGIWSGWAAGAKYAGSMSCKYACDVARPAAAVQASPEPRLHLSRQLVVIPARKRALARAQAQD